MENDLLVIQKFVGSINIEQLRYVDSFVGEDMALFMPVGGACYYALIPEHAHPSYMFVLPFDDRTSLMLDGKVITTGHGRLFALSPEIPHHELPSDYPPRYIAIFINKEFFEKQLREYPVRGDVIFRGGIYDPGNTLLPLLRKFIIEADNKIPGTGVVLNAISLEICHSIIRTIFGFSLSNDRISHRLEINRVIEYIHSNPGEKLTIEEMAKIAHLSPSHFVRIFKEEIGDTPIEYLNHVRMERVKKLLLADERSITEIALECGFNNPSYLSTRFYKQYKLTPSEYRKGLKKGQISKKDNKISKD